jgi:uncharacterized protein YndB with AHSA1/START domain
MSSIQHVFEIYIQTTPESLWEAITTPEQTRKYLYGTSVECSLVPGTSYVYRAPGGSVALQGAVLEVEPEKRLVMTFIAMHDPEMSRDRPSRISWEILGLGEACKLTFTHSDFDGETKTYRRARSDWPLVLSGLKTLLETGEPLRVSMGAK